MVRVDSHGRPKEKITSSTNVNRLTVGSHMREYPGTQENSIVSKRDPILGRRTSDTGRGYQRCLFRFRSEVSCCQAVMEQLQMPFSFLMVLLSVGVRWEISSRGDWMKGCRLSERRSNFTLRKMRPWQFKHPASLHQLEQH